MDPHRTDYVLRIGDEQGLTVLVDQGINHYKRVGVDAEASLTKSASKKDDATRSFAELEIRQAHAARARLSILKLEHMHYKHDSIAYALRVAAAASDKRAEVATIAASAAMQALEQARIAALHAQHQAPSAAVSSTKAASGENSAADAEAAARAIITANDARVVGDSAAALASAIAGQRGKPGFAVAAGVVARAMVVSLAAREGSLLTAGAVDTSRSAAEMETLADAEAPTALAEAETRGIDLGELHTAAVAAAQSAEIVAHGTTSAAAAAGLAGTGVAQIDTAAVVADLASYIYLHGDPRNKTRAALMHMFHHSLHDRFTAARDLLLMSKLQETITSTDVKVQVSGLPRDSFCFALFLHPCSVLVLSSAGPVQPLSRCSGHGCIPLRPLGQCTRVPRRAVWLHAHQGATCPGHCTGLPWCGA
jgi:hypothetical protein